MYVGNDQVHGISIVPAVRYLIKCNQFSVFCVFDDEFDCKKHVSATSEIHCLSKKKVCLSEVKYLPNPTEFND